MVGGFAFAVTSYALDLMSLCWGWRQYRGFVGYDRITVPYLTCLPICSKYRKTYFIISFKREMCCITSNDVCIYKVYQPKIKLLQLYSFRDEV